MKDDFITQIAIDIVLWTINGVCLAVGGFFDLTIHELASYVLLLTATLRMVLLAMRIYKDNKEKRK